MRLAPESKKFLDKIPQFCGVYFFFNKNRKPLYVGKAANLKNRLKQYFSNKDKRTFVAYLLKEAKTVNFERAGSEIEALILESRYIKELKPKYNIKLRDDKQYFYAAITKDEFPKIFIAHRPDKINGKEFMGPFTDGSAIKTALKLLRRIFPYCDCKQKHNNFCLNYHIGKCPGFCCLKNQESKITDKKTYAKNIKTIKEILTGKKDALIRQNEKDLKKLGREGKFEEAIKLQKQTEKLKKVFQNAMIIHNHEIFGDEEIVLRDAAKILKIKHPPRRIEGYDVSNIQGVNATGSMVVFENGKPEKKEYRKFKIRGKFFINNSSPKQDDTAMLKEVLARRLNHPEWPLPDLILIDGGKGQLSAALAAIGGKIPVIALTKNKKHRGVKIYLTGQKEPVYLSTLPDKIKNLITLIDAEAHRFAIAYHRKLRNYQHKP